MHQSLPSTTVVQRMIRHKKFVSSHKLHLRCKKRMKLQFPTVSVRIAVFVKFRFYVPLFAAQSPLIAVMSPSERHKRANACAVLKACAYEKPGTHK